MSGGHDWTLPSVTICSEAGFAASRSLQLGTTRLTNDELASASFSLPELVLACTVAGVACQAGQVSMTTTADWGNCFTIHPPATVPDALANVDNFGCLNGDRHADRLRNGNGLCHGHDDELPNPLWIWHRARDAHALGQSHRLRKPLFDRHANRLHLSDPDQLAEQYSHVLGNRFAFGHCHSIALAGSLCIRVAKRFPVLERVRNQHSNEQHVALHDWNSLFERLAFGHRDGFAKRLRNHELDADDVDDCLVDAIQLGVSLVHVDPDTVQLRVKHPHPQQLADADRDSAGNASRDDDRNVNCNAHPNWNSLGDHDPAAVQHRDSRPSSVVDTSGVIGA
ncbi:hypothetical protein FNF28_03654 [Cafeteria roenbergensis]|uniref:Uncharacterized protein n=1 Tax=Cafeteria roenbergensis TaxID=33653 RepID=A0A5A8DLR4_CAFRO|nr:hypothetical protein FNF28_03654 [Cafeteria roenbergensis]